MLKLDPNDRIKTEEALKDEFIKGLNSEDDNWDIKKFNNPHEGKTYKCKVWKEMTYDEINEYKLSKDLKNISLNNSSHL